MAREIEREHVTNELLKVKFEEAGYEIVLEEDGDLSIMRTGVNMRLSNFNQHASIRLRGHMILNNQLSDEELDQFVKEVNYDSYSIRFIGHRWDDGDIGLFGNYVIYYPFGLNLPNLIFTVRQFVDAMRAIFEEHKSAGKYFPETN